MPSVAQNINAAYERFFYGLGLSIAKRPALFLLFSLGIGLLSIGLILAEEEKDIYKLWVEDSSPVHKERDFDDEFFVSQDSRTDTMLIVDKTSAGRDVATRAHYQEVLAASYAMVEEVKVTIDGVEYGYFDVCDRYDALPSLQAGGLDKLVCNRFHPLDCFQDGGFDYDIKGGPALRNPYPSRPWLHELESDDELKQVITDGLNNVECTDGLGVEGPVNFRFAGIERDADDNIISIASVQNVFSVAGPDRVAQQLCNCEFPDDAEKDLGKRVVLGWEAAYQNAMGQLNDEDVFEHIYITYFTQRAVADLVDEAGEADTDLIVAGYVTMAVFTCLSLIRRNPVKSRILVGLVGIFLVAISVAGGMGLTAIAGIKFAPTTTQVLPFLALGLGVDDMFVLAHSFSLWGFDSVEEATADCMRRAGASITLTSVTNVIAFAIGSSIPLPAVSEFSAAASLAVLVNYFVILFGFTAVLVLDGHRQKAHRFDILVWMVHDQSRVQDMSSKGGNPSEEVANAHPSKIGTWFGTLVTKPVVKVAVMVAFTGFFAFTCYGVTEAEIGLPLADIVPSGSFADDWLTQRERFYGDWNSALVVGFDRRTGGLADWDFTDEDNQQALLLLEEELQSVYKMNPDLPVPIFSWLADVIAFAGSEDPLLGQDPDFITATGVIRSEDFNFVLQQYLLSDQALTVGGSLLIQYVGDTSTVERLLAARTTMLHIDLFETSEYVRVIRETRAILGDSPVPAFPSGVVYQLYDQYKNVKDYLVEHLIYVGIAIVFVSFAFLLHPVATLLMVAVITMIIVEVYGLLAFSDLKVNGVTAVNMVMAVGVSVEFTAHIVRAFMISPGNRDARTVLAMEEMTMPVVNGAMSTFLGFVFMAGASFPYFRLYFFNMYALVICIGLLNGLFLLPVLLSLAGPGSLSDSGAVKKIDDHQPAAAVPSRGGDAGSGGDVEMGPQGNDEKPANADVVPISPGGASSAKLDPIESPPQVADQEESAA